MKVEEKTFRFFKVSFYIMVVALLVLVAIVLYFVGEKPKMCVEVIPENKYDLNSDGVVDISDLAIKVNEVIEVRDYILDENQDIREK